MSTRSALSARAPSGGLHPTARAELTAPGRLPAGTTTTRACRASGMRCGALRKAPRARCRLQTLTQSRHRPRAKQWATQPGVRLTQRAGRQCGGGAARAARGGPRRRGAAHCPVPPPDRQGPAPPCPRPRARARRDTRRVTRGGTGAGVHRGAGGAGGSRGGPGGGGAAGAAGGDRAECGHAHRRRPRHPLQRPGCAPASRRRAAAPPRRRAALYNDPGGRVRAERIRALNAVLSTRLAAVHTTRVTAPPTPAAAAERSPVPPGSLGGSWGVSRRAPETPRRKAPSTPGTAASTCSHAGAPWAEGGRDDTEPRPGGI